MKNLAIVLTIILLTSSTGLAQERYGRTANIGLGIGYYGYINHSVPVLHFNYEFDVAKDFTVAPFIGFYSYRRDYWWGNPNKPFKYYTYRRTVIPIGAKGTYYFDDILDANSKWDFYLGASLGLNIFRERWSDGYEGDPDYFRGNGGAVYLDLHIGTEYKFNERIGMFLDLSTGLSTIGIAIHGK